jgi:DNA repair protein RadC
LSEDKLNIKAWAEEDRPREKLMLKGKSSLSDAELLAIMIGSGNKNETAVALCQRILKDYENNLAELSKATITDLMKYKGVGEAKAITIVATLELANRRNQSQVKDKIKINSSRDTYQFFSGYMADLPHEEFWVLFLNRANKVLAREQMSSGGITGTVVDTRLLMKRALELLSTSIVLIHNHPSGNLTPSDEDKKLTKKLKEAASSLDIHLLDHLIISNKGYYSFADEHML